MTNLYVPAGLRAHKLSAAVGSGKTRAAIAWLSSPSTATRNVLYVAPTRALIDQTARDLQRAIAAASGPVRNVHRVRHMHGGLEEVGQAQAEALELINEASEGDGQVCLITTQTFLALVSQVRAPGIWSVILDEAFTPATFDTFELGEEARRGWDHFCELFLVEPDKGHRILPRVGKSGAVDEVARGIFGSVGGRFRGFESLARGVANPAIRCELVLTDGARALLAGEEPTKRGAAAAERGTDLQFASYVDPSAFSAFREVLFLSALFEQTVLYHLWSKALGVVFEEHPDFPSDLLRDTHKEQGKFLAVGHLLHRRDRASLHNLQRDVLTGKPGQTRRGSRVIDHLVQTAAAHFGEERFLLQTNERFGYRKDAACVPRHAVVIPTMAHGSNAFQDVDNVAALALTNPNPQALEWIKDRTGMDAEDVTRAYRIHATYQALGRCSIRRAEQTSSPKVVLAVGADDARFLHGLFPGSHWLGQVGTLPSLSELHEETEEREPSKAEALAQAIREQLRGIPQGTDKVSSRSLKAMVEANLTGDTIPSGVGGRVAAQTWKRALALACVLGSGWQRDRQSLHRITAARYGFTEEAAAA